MRDGREGNGRTEESTASFNFLLGKDRWGTRKPSALQYYCMMPEESKNKSMSHTVVVPLSPHLGLEYGVREKLIQYRNGQDD